MPGRRDLVIGTAGHIDHGKTALVRALTGVDTDRLPAEKQRGITIDLGFASLDLEGRKIALVDVPGHERFIRNMLAGASGLDLALLVVAADDSVMPQTREHLQILQILGLSGGVIALTKVDLVDAAWLALVEDDIRVLVAGTFLESSEIVRTSVYSGQGIEDLKQSLIRLHDQAPARVETGLFRMAIDRSFTLAGRGTIVTGTVASGEVAVGDELEWFPSGRSVKVRGLHRHDRAVDVIGRGARAAINLSGVHHAEVVRGQELTTPGYLVATRILGVEVLTLDDAIRPLRHRGRYRIHLGTAEVSATLAFLRPDRAESTALELAQLILAEPVVAVHGQPFVLREESPPSTLGGGRVLHPSARRRIRPRDRVEIERLARLASPDPKTRIIAALGSYGLTGWTERALTRDSGVPIGQIGPTVEALRLEKTLKAIPLGPRRSTLVLAEVVEALEARVLRALARLHEASPRFSGIVRGRVASSLADLENDALVWALIERLKAAGKVVADTRTVALADHVPKLSQAERKLKREILDAYRVAGFSPPDPSEWSSKLANRASTVAELLDLLVNEEQIVEIGPGLYLDAEAEAEMCRRVADRLANGDPMTMAELRDLLQTSRKFAVPIAEYLDRIGWTERAGDLRTLGPASRAVGIEKGRLSL
jgi:selenocysteine-specific elongation factor